jgi:hypothetical protein
MQSEQVLLPLSPMISNGSFHMGAVDTRGGQDFFSRECYESVLNYNNFMLYPPPALNNNNSGSSPEVCKPPSKGGRYIRQDSVASSSHSAQTACNSASDEAEEQQIGMIDERKKRRMLSNRESARRSRMRKQKHLDELRAQVAHMRGENRQILSSFDILTQRYSQALEENRVLKAQGMELSQQLHQLQQAIAASQSSAAASPFVLNAFHHNNNNNIINIDEAVDTNTNSLSQCLISCSDNMISCPDNTI